jgi:hypothetical protein
MFAQTFHYKNKFLVLKFCAFTIFGTASLFETATAVDRDPTRDGTATESVEQRPEPATLLATLSIQDQTVPHSGNPTFSSSSSSDSSPSALCSTAPAPFLKVTKEAPLPKNPNQSLDPSKPRPHKLSDYLPPTPLFEPPTWNNTPPFADLLSEALVDKLTQDSAPANDNPTTPAAETSRTLQSFLRPTTSAALSPAGKKTRFKTDAPKVSEPDDSPSTPLTSAAPIKSSIVSPATQSLAIQPTTHVVHSTTSKKKKGKHYLPSTTLPEESENLDDLVGLSPKERKEAEKALKQAFEPPVDAATRPDLHSVGSPIAAKQETGPDEVAAPTSSFFPQQGSQTDLFSSEQQQAKKTKKREKREKERAVREAEQAAAKAQKKRAKKTATPAQTSLAPEKIIPPSEIPTFTPHKTLIELSGKMCTDLKQQYAQFEQAVNHLAESIPSDSKINQKLIVWIRTAKLAQQQKVTQLLAIANKLQQGIDPNHSSHTSQIQIDRDENKSLACLGELFLALKEPTTTPAQKRFIVTSMATMSTLINSNLLGPFQDTIYKLSIEALKRDAELTKQLLLAHREP